MESGLGYRSDQPSAFQSDGSGTFALVVLGHAPGTLRGHEQMDQGESLDRVAITFR